MPRIDVSLLARLYRDSDAERWGVAESEFAGALERGIDRAFAGRAPSAREIRKHLASLHLTDLALALGCAGGDSRAWDTFIPTLRPALYRAADALDASGGARDVADALFADLYGLRERDGRRQSLFEHYHGRSNLATWLRAVLAQRHVDAIRAARRTEPLTDVVDRVSATPAGDVDPNYERLRAMVHTAIADAVAGLDPRDRLRLACYYQRQLNLAATGRILQEHEATVSRRLAHTRRLIRESVEQCLRTRAGLSAAEIADCLAAVAIDPGTLDLGRLFRKDSLPDRSI